MNDFKELDTALQVPGSEQWYIGVHPAKCGYLHNDLELHPETINNVTGKYEGLWDSELDALNVCRHYYLLHGRAFPYSGRFIELSSSGSTQTLCDSQPMVFN